MVFQGYSYFADMLQTFHKVVLTDTWQNIFCEQISSYFHKPWRLHVLRKK